MLRYLRLLGQQALGLSVVAFLTLKLYRRVRVLPLRQQIFKAMRMVNEGLKGKGIWAMDRGADREEIAEELARLRARYVIRCRGDRLVETRQGRCLSISEIAKRTKSDRRYKVTVDEQGHKEDREVYAGVRKDVNVEGVLMNIVIVRGFGRKPLMLMTNVDKEPQDILDIYLTRWKCEESFRFLKQEYHLEDVRVRSYTALRNTMAIMHAVFYFLSVYLHRGIRVSILLEKILEKAKRFFEIPVFKHYAIADGIYRLLFNQKWMPERTEEFFEDKRQLSFAFD